MGRSREILTADEIILINQGLIQRFGGFLTDENDNFMRSGALEQLLEECQGAYFGEERYPSVIDKAAMFGWRIIAGHVFRDGNKRTGLQVCRTILHLHRYDLPINEDVRDIILSIAKGDVSLDDFTAWLAHTAVQL